MPLTNVQIRAAKPQAKPYKLSDGGALFLLVQPTGSKWWRYKYRWMGKEKLLALGSYPDVTLADAREGHAQARRVSVSDFMRRVKGCTSRKIQQEFPELRKRYWGRRFWARGYFCTTSGNVTNETILNYIANHTEDEPTDSRR